MSVEIFTAVKILDLVFNVMTLEGYNASIFRKELPSTLNLKEIYFSEISASIYKAIQ
jgi:hypothetical protein